MKEKRNRAAIACNVLILIFEILGFSMGVSPEMFIYYTNLSNLAAAIACLAVLLAMSGRFGEKMEKAAYRLKYTAVCMTTVTFAVVVCILVPMQGVQMLYRGNFLSFHLLCPVMMLLSFLFFDPIGPEREKGFTGMLPTLLYAAAAIVCNCLGVLDGPYPFLKVREQPVYMSVLWCAVILGIAWLIAYLLKRFRGHFWGCYFSSI